MPLHKEVTKWVTLNQSRRLQDNLPPAKALKTLFLNKGLDIILHIFPCKNGSGRNRPASAKLDPEMKKITLEK